jgi:hypothetical protein
MSKMEDLENRIREQRLLEANSKGLVGASGKIGTVLMSLGHEIVGQGGDSAGWWEEEEEDSEDPRNPLELMKKIPVMDVDGNMRPEGPEWSEMEGGDFYSTRRVGFHFDGLGMGMHMEILYDEESSALSLTHRGVLSYREVMGELEAYVPNEEWEGWVNRLYKVAKKRQRAAKEDEFREKAEEAEAAKEGWLDRIRKRWGAF